MHHNNKEPTIRTWQEIRDSKDPLDNLVIYINGLSPWNLWKAHEVIEAWAAQKVIEGQTKGVAWAIGIIDELHLDRGWEDDKTFKGIKNTLRDRYKAEIGVDPAPSYPIKTQLTNNIGGEDA